MAPVPAWTREWRPLARQLCARVLDRQPHNGYNDEEAPSSLPQETLLLRADRVVGQLYSHRFADCLPQDVQSQTQALATKFRVHSLDDRAEKLLQLSAKCDPQVLKLLLELATAPTSASDRDVAVDEDEDAPSAWKTALQQEASRQERQKLMQDQLVEELFQISTNDEWYQAWDDSDDEDSAWSEVDDVVVAEQSPQPRQRNGKRSSDVMEEEASEAEIETVEEALDEETMRDRILCRYYPEVELDGEMERDTEEIQDPACALLEKNSLVPFTLERPWLLCEAVVKSGSIENGAAPRRLIHERTVVSMVFEALDGVESLMFELRPAQPTPVIFSVDFRTKAVGRSRRSLGVAVGHLSPLALHHVLDEFAVAASELQLLRDLLGFIRRARDLSEQHRCVTLEGLANALSGVVGELTQKIRTVEQETCSAPALIGDSETSLWSGVAARQPSLLGVLGGLRETFKLMSWLKRVLVKCFQGLSERQWHEIRRAEQAKCVLDALYYMMEVEYIEGVAADEKARAAGGLSRSEVLLRLFVGALNPYLDLVNRMLFERGHFETIPLDGELFFATPASISVNASPMRERNQSFREGLLSLAPFEVHRSLVPSFLEPVVDLMNEALTSRQMKNRFLQHQQLIAEGPLVEPRQPRPSLRELLRRELETMGCGVQCGSLSLAQRSGASLQRTMMECVPFNRILERCLTRHIEDKCQELNGEVTDLFREKMNYMEHVEALRMFVLMEQQDVFNVFSEMLVAHMQENPVAWADSEKINAFHQSAVQGVFEDNSLSSSQRQTGGRLCVRVDFNRLDGATGGAKIDIATMKCLHFTFAAQQPLRVLFSASIMQKYSRLGVFLVQVKAVESALVKFKSALRHRRCYSLIETDMRQLLIQVADMLHYTKSILNYLTSQISREGWSKYCHILRSSRSLAEMDATHEQYLEHLLNRFFLLDKHAAVIQYILTTFNHILRFVSHVDDFVSAVDRNMREYFPTTWSEGTGSGEKTKPATSKTPKTRLLLHPDFNVLYADMIRSANEFKRQSHFLVVMLTAMQKHGASPHVNEMVTQLNYNYFYHQQESRSRVQQPAQQHQQQYPVSQARRGPQLNRAESLRDPPAPKKFSRTRSVHMT